MPTRESRKTSYVDVEDVTLHGAGTWTVAMLILGYKLEFVTAQTRGLTSLWLLILS